MECIPEKKKKQMYLLYLRFTLLILWRCKNALLYCLCYFNANTAVKMTMNKRKAKKKKKKRRENKAKKIFFFFLMIHFKRR